MCNHVHIIDYIKRLVGDETQAYIDQMRRERTECSPGMTKLFNKMFGNE